MAYRNTHKAIIAEHASEEATVSDEVRFRNLPDGKGGPMANSDYWVLV